MSRTRHARPPAATGSDEISRVRNAATDVADAYIRFERNFARLQRSLGEAHQAGVSDGDLARAVQTAGSGRADRTKALNAVFDRVKTPAPEALRDTQRIPDEGRSA